MNVTRRHLIGSSACGIAAALTAPTSWAQANVPRRISLSAFSTRPEKVEQLRALFSKMRQKRASDPASYFFQGAVHWLPDLSPSAVKARPDLKVLAEMFNADPAAKQMLGYWDQCTHGGMKSSADFLLWHRAYLHYFEQHARVTLGDPTFALPYWDYNEQEASRRLPDIFLDAKINGQDNPLYPIRGLPRSLNTASKTLSKADVALALVMNNDYFFSEPGIEGMGEDIGLGTAIDNTPHGHVHGGIGGWMGSVETAAFDPVFWMHHCNIDRLFNLWMGKKRFWSRTMSSSAIESWLSGGSYRFFGGDGKLAIQSRGFFLDQRNLGYAYDTDPIVMVPPELPPPQPSLATSGAVDAMGVDKRVKGFLMQPAGGLPEPISVSASSGGVATLPLALPSSPASGPVPLAVHNQVSSKLNRTYVVLSEIRKDGELGGNYGVFVGPLASEAKDASSPAYVGRFSSFEAPAIGQPRPGYRRSFDVTHLVAKLGSDARSLVVRVAPMQAADRIGNDAPGKLVMKIEVQSAIASLQPVK